jgi:hypothetical protein
MGVGNRIPQHKPSKSGPKNGVRRPRTQTPTGGRRKPGPRPEPPIQSVTRIEWKEDFPSSPGFYWFRGRLGRSGDETDGPELVRVLATQISERIPATVTVTGRNNRYGLHSCRGEWAGPLEPPTSSNNHFLTSGSDRERKSVAISSGVRTTRK